LGLRIELTEGLERVAEELESDGPGSGEGEDIDDAAAQGEFAALSDLGFGFVGLVLEPLDQVQWVEGIALAEAAEAASEVVGVEGALGEGGCRSDDDGCGEGRVIGGGEQGSEGLEAVSEHLGLGQAAFVGKDIPSGERTESRGKRLTAGSTT